MKIPVLFIFLSAFFILSVQPALAGSSDFWLSCCASGCDRTWGATYTNAGVTHTCCQSTNGWTSGYCPPAIVPITITSSPTGSGFVIVDSTAITTPKTYSWQVGSTHTISANSYVSCGDGCRYAFDYWSDGGVKSHVITVPSSAATYTAHFKQQFRLDIEASPSNGGTTSPSAGSYWYDENVRVSVSAAPVSDYVFSQWVGYGTDSYSGTSSSGSFYMKSPVSETAHFIKEFTLDAKVDVLNTNLDGVQVNVDGITKTTSGGSVSYTLTPGSHSVSVPSSFSGRPFSHFWDQDIDADCAVDYYNTESNPYSFQMPSCGKGITAYYKVFTKIVDLYHDGSTISGRLLMENNRPLITSDSRTVRLSHDGILIKDVTASSSDGSFSYSWSCSTPTQVKAEFIPDSWFYVGSSATADAACCENECSAGQKQCLGNYVQTCGNYDSDPCMEWSTTGVCSSGFICSNGACIEHLVPITITSSPTGSGFVIVDNTAITTPKTYSWQVGSTHTLSANSVVTCGEGCRYALPSWSDGGDRTHVITVPSSAATYTASFTTQYQLTTSASPSGSCTVSPNSGQWYNRGTRVFISATPATNYVFSSWTGYGTVSYTGTAGSEHVTMNSPISQTAYCTPVENVLTVEAKVDVLNTNLDGVQVNVDGITKPTSGGSVSYSLTPGSHSVSVPSSVSGRPFSHFWDHDSNADCVSNDVDTASNPYSFSMPSSCGKIVTAFYKAFTSITDLAYDGSIVSGYLLDESDRPLISADDRTVRISYYDGTWHTVGNAVASTLNGYFTYNWASCPAGATQVKAEFLPSEWYYVGSSATVQANCGCALMSVSIVPNCADGLSADCETGETVQMVGTYSGYCTGADFFQIDAYGDGCDIQYMDGDMSGIWDSSITMSSGSVSGSWTIPSIPKACEGKTVETTYSTIRNGGATGNILSGTWNTGGSMTFYQPCDCAEWKNQGCGGGSCASSQMYQARSCDPEGCGIESQCAGPSYGQWTSVGCGGQCGSQTCSVNEQCQIRTDTYGCAADEYRCVDDEDCKSFKFNIYVGWNLISSPIRTVQGTMDDSCGAAGGSFYYYDRDTSEWVVDTVGIQNLKPGVSYWFHSEKNCNVTIHGFGEVDSSDIRIKSGWNHIASPSAGLTNVGTVMSSCSDFTALWYNPVTKSFEESNSLQPGKGYNVQCIS